jgi:hypothetical protein
VWNEGQVIGHVVAGDDGSWWLTLTGALPTTLGPSRSLEAITRRASRLWHTYNPPTG